MTHRPETIIPDAHRRAGVDAAKGWLDVAHGATVERVDNAAPAIAGLLARLKGAGVAWVGIEPTGGYERLFVALAREAGLEVRLVDPWRLHQFAKARGRRAKTDPLDARLIHAYLGVHPTRPWPAPDPVQEALNELVRELARLEAGRRAAENRLEGARHARVRDVIAREIASLAALAREVEAALDALVAESPPLAERARRLTSMAGVGLRTARVLLAELPELGLVSGRAIAGLAGVAPYTSRSGTQERRARIAGGRDRVRRALFMCAMASRLHSPWARAVYDGLRRAGKPHKVAVIALARRILVILNAMCATRQDWNPDLAQHAT